MSKETIITIKVTDDGSNSLGIKMDCPDDFLVADLLRVTDSLTTTTQNLLEKYCKDSEKIQSMKDVESVKLSDLSKN